ncbi:two-component system sensor histidine kinase YcbA [Neobacillus ginsengisoli]|uniref:histidine kinase n=2 Tax=Neobacillus ginsengisoli TaxID=904295 RepID=A0ABT9XW45_9BACI|nr:two-component system sensor histidine kinase YcbA [Neobacillus ginsengisoli]
MIINPLMKKDIFILILMMVTVPIAGELNFYPINETFRISFAVPTFLFFLLLFRKIPVVLPGLLTAILVVGFRILIEWIKQENFNWNASFESNFSSFFFYLAYSCFFYLAKVSRFNNRLIIIGFIGITIEILSDIVELTMQYFVLGTTIKLAALSDILIIAISHSFIVLSFFTMIKLYEAQARERQIRKQNEHMLMLISNLYEESIHLKKTLVNAENITKKSYDLYKSLNGLKNEWMTADSIEEIRKKALKIAGEVHEIKKDNQRIFAGLSKLISVESFTDYMNLHELVSIIKRTNEKYSSLLGKDIQILYSIKGDHPHYHVFTLLSIINNIVTNAVEAINDVGTITINIERKQKSIEFRIGDNGPGVAPKHKNLIFKPGFTSKYDRSGNPSTGMGLSFIKDIVKQLEGDITVEDRIGGPGSIFIITLLVDHLIEKG